VIKPSNIPLSDQLENVQLDLEAAVTSGYPRVIIDDLRRQSKVLSETIDIINHPNYAVQTLKDAICEAFGIQTDELLTKTRKRKVVNARQVYVYVLITAFDLPGYEGRCKGRYKGVSFLQRHFGFNHCTSIHCVDAVSNYMDTEALYKEKVPEFIAGVQNGLLSVEFSGEKIQDEISDLENKKASLKNKLMACEMFQDNQRSAGFMFRIKQLDNMINELIRFKEKYIKQ
jgi:hypothetical protein